MITSEITGVFLILKRKYFVFIQKFTLKQIDSRTLMLEN
jgi:hypothetical protein